ncbi:MAG: hypothetical protein ABI639_16870, partial [Thermoanaerobaculia bacterium]
ASAKVRPRETMAPDSKIPSPADRARAELAATIAGLRAAVRQRQGEAATIPTGADELQGLLLELQRHEFVQEPQPVSPRPVYGRWVVFVRKAFYHLLMKWQARAVLQQQNSFNQSASRLLAELAQRQKRAAEANARLEQQLLRLETLLESAGGPFASVERRQFPADKEGGASGSATG